MKQHPYYPVDLQLPNYVPNDRSVLELLGVFFGFVGCSLVLLWLIISGLPHMKNNMLLKLKVCWFFLCGLIHLVLEGYFGLFNQTIPEGKSFLAELCEFIFFNNVLLSLFTACVCTHTPCWDVWRHHVTVLSQETLCAVFSLSVFFEGCCLGLDYCLGIGVLRPKQLTRQVTHDLSLVPTLCHWYWANLVGLSFNLCIL